MNVNTHLSSLKVLLAGVAGLLLAANSQAQEVSSGQSQDLDVYETPYAFSLPPGKTTADIRGVAIAGSNDHVYAWYDDATVSSGTSWNLDAYQSPRAVSTIPGYTLNRLVAVAIAGSNDHVYYYWTNGVVSQGTSTAPMAYALPVAVNFPPNKGPQDLRGVGIAGSNDHVYAWFADGTVSQGTSVDLDAYAAPQSFDLAGSYDPQDLAGVGIAGSNDHVYAWFHAESIGDGFATLEAEIDAAVLDFIEDNNLAGATVAVSKQGNMVFDKGYGLADLDTGERMEPYHRSRIGSVSKIVTALAFMKHAEDLDPAGLGLLDEPLYGLSGLLPSVQFAFDQTQGRRRHTPVVGTVIRKSDDRVFTYYDDGTVSSGTSWDLDAHTPAQAFSWPATQEPRDIRGMAADSFGNVYVWYRNGSLSAGTFYDLASGFYFDTEVDGVDGASVATGRSFDHLVGAGIAASSNKVYAWYEDGTKSVGNIFDLAADSEEDPFTVAGGKTSYDLRSLAIAGNDRVYAFYGNDTVSSGTSWDLDYHSGLYATTVAAGISAQPWNSWYASMTPRHLLTHTAGFFGGGDKSATARMFGVPDIEDLTYTQVHRHMLRTRPLRFAPATADRYSNHGLGLVGYVLEELTGEFYPDWTEANVLEPLGLDFGRSWDLFGPLDARPHEVTAGGTLYRCSCISSSLSTQAGGWTASAGDLVRLMLATDQDPGRPDVLLPSTLDEMESTPFPAATSRAHGWKVLSGGRLSHSGSTGGGRAYMVKHPNGYTAGDGTDLSDIFVAVALNTGGDGIDIGALLDEVALITGSNFVSSYYDIY